MDEIEANGVQAPTDPVNAAVTAQMSVADYAASAMAAAAQNDAAAAGVAQDQAPTPSSADASAAQTVMDEIKAALHHLELLPSTTAAWFKTKLKELEDKL